MKTTIYNLLVLLLSLIPTALSATNAPTKPDFAYPKTVAQNAQKQLERALNEGNGIATVRAVIDLSLAESAISNDSINTIIARIEKIKSQEPNADTKALLDMLLADIYGSIYNNSRWKYDNRDLPISPLPSDIAEWSGTHFKAKITELCRSSLSSPDSLKSEQLKNYSDIITGDTHTYSFYPTLYDFIATQAISQLKRLSESQFVLPGSLLCRYDIYETLKFKYTDATARQILEIYQDLLKFHEGNPAPFAITDINRIEFIDNHTFDHSVESAYKPLHELYLLLGNSQYAGEALIAMGRNGYSYDDARLKTFIDEVDAFLKRHPSYFRANTLRNIRSQYTQKSVTVSSQGIIAPGKSLNVKISVKNANKYSLRIFRVPYAWDRSSQYIARKNSESPVLIKTIDFTKEGTTPFSSTDSIDVLFDTPGCYVIVPAIDDKKPQIEPSKYYQRIHCTELSIATASFASQQWAWVINPLTGAPTDAAKLQLYNSGGDDKSFITTSEGKTDLSKIDFPQYNWTLYASKGIDKYAMASKIYRRQAVDTSAVVCANMWTALSIYHPGDTVQFCGVLYSAQGKSHRLLKSASLTLELRDANYQEKATKTFVTDEWGRFEGTFPLPAEGLNGRFSIVAKQDDNQIETTSFMVSDYKLPSYQVEVTDISRNNPTTGAVTVKGRASTYSGFPLSDININVELSVSQRYRLWRNRSVKYQNLSVSTSSDGTFTIVFPADMLAEAPIENGIFTARITATNATGENQETSIPFSLGDTYSIACAIDDDSDFDASSPVRLNIRVTDLMDKTITIPVSYTLYHNNNNEVKHGVFSSSEPIVDWSDVPVGSYSIRFYLDSNQSDTVTINNIGIYRPTDAMPPKTVPIWLPSTSYTLKNSRRASILYGTTASISHINYTIWDNDTIYRQEWLSVKPGIHRFEFTLPEGIDNVNVSMMATSDYRSTQKNISILSECADNSITIEAEAFRDHITPGAKETWRFHIKDRSGTGKKAALMFDMYSKALDVLSPQHWQFNVTNRPLNRFAYNTSEYANRYFSTKEITIKHLKENDIIVPDFQMWGMGFTKNAIRNFRVMRSTKSTFEEAVMLEDSAAAFGTTDNGIADTESAVEEESATQAQDRFSYRASEIPLAFFRPMLTTADDGSLEFSFTAPNANTTWQFCAMAFTPDLSVASMAKEILSNKPIMVQPNMPRFIRTGDYIDILASVMNNSDTLQTVTTVIEIFDPATNNTLNQSQQIDTISAGTSVIARIGIKAPFDTNMLGYRIKSSATTFSDGEQSVIPILPSSTPVIDTKPFYIASGETSYMMQLPEDMPKDAHITLEFCENPIWYCVTALPGLRAENSHTSLGAVAEIFSAAVAEGIIRTNPAIARALHQWQISDKSDSTLISMLERNQDLKNILLNSTPWVMDARSDTERMARLAILFDKDEIDAVYSHAIHRLAQLQRNEGGWAWIEENENASIWATYNILANLGRLKQLGFLPDNAQLQSMIINAVKKIDAYAAEEYRKNPKADFTDYVITRDYYSDIKQSTAAARVTQATVQRLVSDWKERDIHGKAVAAIILDNNGYHATARQILTSLREYSHYTPQRGMWWPSLDESYSPFHKLATTSLILDAFHFIEPGCKEIDQIRQWLILQKESENWGTSNVTSDVIASILLSGSDWIKPATGSLIKIGDKKIPQTNNDKTLGYLRIPIQSAGSAGKDLTITKAAGNPSWGAVYCQYSDVMNQVKASSCEAVAIEKQLFTQNGLDWISTDTITVGSRVKVQLTLRVSRDMDYVTITDERAACFEPTEQIPHPIYSENLCFYRENRDASTNIFISRLPKGTYILNYELYANNSGSFASGIATIQSQYAPALSAHSSGSMITVAE